MNVVKSSSVICSRRILANVGIKKYDLGTGRWRFLNRKMSSRSEWGEPDEDSTKFLPELVVNINTSPPTKSFSSPGRFDAPFPHSRCSYYMRQH